MVFDCRKAISSFLETMRRKAHGEQAKRAWRKFDRLMMYRVIIYEIFYLITFCSDVASQTTSYDRSHILMQDVEGYEGEKA